MIVDCFLDAVVSAHLPHRLDLLLELLEVLGLRFASEDGDPFCDLQDLVESIYVIADSLKPSIAMDFIVRVLRETSDCEVEHAFEKVVYWHRSSALKIGNLVSFSLSILKFSMAMISIAILVFLAE